MTSVGHRPPTTLPLLKGVACERRDIPRNRLHLSPLNVRHDQPPEDLEAFAAEVREMGGIHTSLWVRPSRTRPGDYEVFAGRRRLAVAQAEYADIDPLPCQVYHVSDQEALALSYAENADRVNSDPVSEARQLRRMLDMVVDGRRLYKDKTDLARGLKRSKQDISQKLALLTLPDDFLDRIQAKRLGFSAAIRIAAYFKDPHEQRLVLSLIEDDSHTVQRNTVDALRHIPQVLSMERSDLKQRLAAVLNDFSPEQRVALRRFYRECGLDPDTIDWTTMTPETYALEVAAKERLLRAKTSAPPTPPIEPARSRPQVAPLGVAPTPRAQELDARMNEVFERITRLELVIHAEGRVKTILLSDLVGVGLRQSTFLEIKAVAATEFAQDEGE